MIEFIEATHTYLLDGTIIPSVSSIIKDDKYKDIPEFILQRAAEKGTAIHKATEDFDLSKPVGIEDKWHSYLLNYFAFRDKFDNIKLILDERESIVYTSEYAGTIDVVANYDNKILIADIKTTSKLYFDSIALQLAAYILAHSEMYNNDLSDYLGAVIWLKKDGYEFHIIEPDYDGFMERLAIWHDKNEVEVLF